MPEDRNENDLSESDNDVSSDVSADAVKAVGVGALLRDIAARMRRILHLDRLDAFVASREPRIGAALLTMVGVAILLGLGTWQVARSHEKNLLIIQVQRDLASAPRDLSVMTPTSAAEWSALNFKPVQLKGAWMPLRNFRLAPRTFAEQIGYQWIIPFQLENGQVILVNRGFIPANMSIVPPQGGVAETLSGVAFVPQETRPRFVPENNPAKGEWIWMDLNAMGHEIGVRNIAPVMVYENRITDKDSYPIGGQVPLPFHNRHWHYAVTWYCLALALMGIWMLAIGPKTTTSAPSEKIRDEDETEEMDPVARRGLYPEATD